VICARQEKSSPGFFMGFLGTIVSSLRLCPGSTPIEPGLFHSVRDGSPFNHIAFDRFVSNRRAVPFNSQGEIMSPKDLSNASLELIAYLIAKGQARVIRKGGKTMVVSRL
jgi:hypothetical protein